MTISTVQLRLYFEISAYNDPALGYMFLSVGYSSLQEMICFFLLHQARPSSACPKLARECQKSLVTSRNERLWSGDVFCVVLCFVNAKICTFSESVFSQLLQRRRNTCRSNSFLKILSHFLENSFENGKGCIILTFQRPPKLVQTFKTFGLTLSLFLFD